MAQAGAVMERLAAAADGLTDIGLNREKNEDFFVYNEARGIFIVADGLGGLAGGEIASRLGGEDVLSHLEKLYARDRFASLDEGKIESTLRHAHEAIVRQSEERRNGRNMGTTIVLAVLGREGGVWVSNVGDSRGYLFRGGRLTQLTMDHSLVEEYRRSNAIVPSMSVASNIVTQALGIELIKPYTVRFEGREGDLLLLCSDGLWNVVSDDRIAAVLGSHEDLRQKCRLLVQSALRAGGSDNITVEVIALKAS